MAPGTCLRGVLAACLAFSSVVCAQTLRVAHAESFRRTPRRAPDQAPDDLAGLKGKTVVTPRTGPLAAYIEKNAPEVKVMRSASYEESLALLVAGKVNVARRMFLEVALAVAVAKGKNAALIRQLNEGIAAGR